MCAAPFRVLLSSLLSPNALGLIAAGTMVVASGCAGPQTQSSGELSAGSAAAASGPTLGSSASTNGSDPSTAPQTQRPGVRETDTLLLDNTPEVPEEMRVRFNRYLNTRGAALSDLSADGKQIVISTRFGQTNQAHIVRTPMGARTQLTFVPEPARSAQFDPRDPNAVVYTADIGGNEQHQIFRLDIKSGTTTRLTDPEARNGAPVWSKDGAWMAYSSNTRNKRDFDIWVTDGRDPASARRIADAKGWWSPVDWSPDNKQLLIRQYISINESILHIVDVATQQVTRLSPPGKAAYAAALFGKDGNTVYVTSDREGEFTEIYATDTKGSQWRPLTRAIPWNVVSMALAPDGRTLAFTTNEDGYSVLRLLDTRTGNYRLAGNLPKGIIGGLRFARNAPIIGFTMSSATSSGDAYTMDTRRGRLTRWTESELGGLSSEQLIEPELIRYPSFDKKEIPGFYYRPKGQGPFPVIIYIHGGPEGQARPRFSALTQYALAESRIAVIYPNVRGSSGYGKTYLTLDNGMRREDSVKDIGALLDWIATRPELDAQRVGVLGGSYGGYMVLASLVHFGDRIAAGTDIVGISDFVTFLENTADYRRDLRRVEYGDERDPEMRAFLQKIAPARNAHKIKSALFVAQGANDPRVPASEAEQIVQAVRAAGHDVWYMLAKNEGHGFARKSNRDLYYLLTMMFFERHLGVSTAAN